MSTYDKSRGRKLTPWTQPDSDIPDVTKVIEGRARRDLADVVEMDGWDRMKVIAQKMIEQSAAGIPSTPGQIVGWVTGSLTRDVLTEFIRRVEEDAAQAPQYSGEE